MLTGTLHTWGIVGFTVFGIPVVGLSVLSGCVDGVVAFGAVTLNISVNRCVVAALNNNNNTKNNRVHQKASKSWCFCGTKAQIFEVLRATADYPPLLI